MSIEGIGASVVRKEDKRFITGKGRYVDDIKLLGMTHAHFIRSPHPHAKIRGIDAAAALKMPGVVAVLTGQEIDAQGVIRQLDRDVVASRRERLRRLGGRPAAARGGGG